MSTTPATPPSSGSDPDDTERATTPSSTWRQNPSTSPKASRRLGRVTRRAAGSLRSSYDRHYIRSEFFVVLTIGGYMRRRDFIAILASGAMAWQHAARAQQ